MPFFKSKNSENCKSKQKNDILHRKKTPGPGYYNTKKVQGQEEEVEEEEKPAEITPERQQEKQQPRKKKLRKRTKSRGHGTLDMLDLEHVKLVDTESIDINSESIQKEFGTFGALPVGSKKLWEIDLNLDRTIPNQTKRSFLREPGSYRLVLNDLTTKANWKNILFGSFHSSSDILVKVWILNRNHGHSELFQSIKLCSSNSHVELDLVVSGDLKKKAKEIRIECISMSKYSTRVSAALHLLTQGVIQDDGIVLDGEDQTPQIQKVKKFRQRARTLSKEKKQAKRNKKE